MCRLSRRERLLRVRLFAIFLGLVFLVVIVRLSISVTTPIGFALHTGLGAAFLFLAIFSRRNERLSKYWQVFFAFFIFSIVPFSWGILLAVIAEQFGWSPEISGFIFLLLNAMLVIIPIILLTKISGGDMGSIYVKRGDLRLGLILGLSGFVVFFVTAVPVSTSFFTGEDITFAGVIPLMPLILVAIFANASLEEFWFRGLLLKKLEPLLGRNSSNLFQAIIFSLAHLSVAYTRFPLQFLAFTFFMALFLGYLMMRTDSILAPILIHAGADVPIFMVILSNV